MACTVFNAVDLLARNRTHPLESSRVSDGTGIQSGHPHASPAGSLLSLQSSNLALIYHCSTW